MMRRFSIVLSIILATFAVPINAVAQELTTLEEYMYSSGKMNVVIMVVFIILVGLYIYLFRMDRKLKQLEEEVKK